MDGATSVLFQYGLAGVVIFGLCIAVVALYKDNQRLHGLISELSDQRRADAVEAVDKVTQPLASISQTMNLIYDKLSVGRGN